MAHPVDRERLFTGYSGRLFVAVSLGWLSIQLGRQLLPPLLPDIIADLGISTTQAGFALTLLWGIYALCQYPSGRLSDRLSRKTLLVAGLALLSAGFVAVMSVTGYPTLLLGAGLVGLGAGLYPTAARALVSDLFVDRRGQAFGIHTASGDLGNAAAAGLAVVVLAVATWQAAFLPVVALLGAVLVAIHLWARERYRIEPVEMAIAPTARRLLGTPRIRRLLAAYALFAFTWQSATGFLPTFLQAEKGFSVALASGGFALFFGVGTLVKPAAGLLGDRFGRVVVAIGALIVGVCGLSGVLVADSAVLVLAAVGVFAAGLMAFPPVMQAFLMDVFPDRSMGGDLGAMRTIYIGIGSVGPTYVGFVAGVESYTVSFLGLIMCMLLSAVTVVSYRRLD